MAVMLSTQNPAGAKKLGGNELPVNALTLWIVSDTCETKESE